MRENPPSPGTKEKGLHVAIAAAVLLVGNAVGHVMRTSENSSVRGITEGAAMWDLYAGASLPGMPELTNPCITNPTPFDQVIDESERAAHQWLSQ